MNPKYPSNLDPKLREAYDRVMGTGAPGAAKPAEHAPTPQEPAPKMVTEPAPPPTEHEEKTTVVHFGADTEKHKKVEKKVEPDGAAATTNKSPVATILLGIIGVLFFIGYGLFWAQIFGFNIIPTS